MRATLIALALLLAAPTAAADSKKPAAPAAAKRKLDGLELCEYQQVILRDHEAQLNLQIAELQQQLAQARADLQRAGLTDKVRALREKAGAKDGELIDPNTGEVKAAPPSALPERK